MDGNGRWESQRGLPRTEGHRAGMNTVRTVVQASLNLGVSVLTVYAFSSENWKRPRQEIDVLMNLLNFFIDREIQELVRKGVRIRTIGRIEALPKKTLEKVRQAVRLTENNDKLILNIALNYGSRTEILDAIRSLIKETLGQKDPTGHLEALTEKDVAAHLYTQGLPDPDLLIRTSGEMRLSNFLLWQLSYAEIYVTEKFWPDFTEADYREAIRVYQSRQRRFGDIGAMQNQTDKREPEV
jgi:undecaprenyl diphosphate synthase